jgi:hypothetical protein
MTATSRDPPIAVPDSVKGGPADSVGGGASIFAGGAGGRCDTEKSGRSRVTESELMGIRDRGLAPGGGCRGSGFSAATNCRCPPVEPIRSKSLETTASWPSAPHAEKEKTAAINQAQRLIIYPPGVALDADCEQYRGVSARYRSFLDMRCAVMRAR